MEDRGLTLRRAAVMMALAGVILAFMAGFGAIVGVAPQRFEWFYELGQYTDDLRAASGPIKFLIFFDNFFVLVYTTAVVLLVWAFRAGRPGYLCVLAAGGIVLTALLDYVENFHFVIMFRALESAESLTAAQVMFQMHASLLKWHAAYLSLFMLSFVLPQDSLNERVVVWSLRLLVPAVGHAVAVASLDVVPILLAMRTTVFVIGFAMMALVAWGRARQHQGPPRVETAPATAGHDNGAQRTGT